MSPRRRGFMQSIKVEVHNSFESCELEINRLNDRAGNNNPFLTADWLKLWWEHFGQGKSLYILLFRDENRVVGFAPFWRTYRRAWRLYECHLLGEGFASYLDMVGEPGSEEAVADSMFQHFNVMSTGAIVHLHDFNDRFSRFFAPLSQKALQDPKWTSSFKLYPCPIAAMGADWHDFFKKQRDRKSRYNLQRAQRLASRLGMIEVREVTDPGELAVLFPQLAGIHGERFRKTVNPLFTGEQGSFLNTVLNQMLPSKVYLSIMTLDDLPVSFLIGFQMGKIFTDFAPAFDPAFSSLSLGQVHLMQVMENRLKEGFEYFDFSKGEQDYKRSWANDETTSYLFRFGFNLNKVGSCYYRLQDTAMHYRLELRERGYNRTLKDWIGRLRQGNIFGRPHNHIVLEEISEPGGVEPIKLPGWSYQQIRNLPVGVRSSIIKYGNKVDLSQMRLDVQPEQRVVTLVSQDGTQGRRFRY